MLRRGLILAIFTIGCTKALPVLIHLDKTFSAEDRAIVLEAIAEWNDRAAPLLRDSKNIFVIGEDIEPFNSWLDLGDNLHGIYYADLEFIPPNHRPGDFFGYTTPFDSLILTNYIRRAITDIPTDEWIEPRDPHRQERIAHHAIKKVAIHELGHLLGLAHYFHRDGIMVPGVPKSVTTISGPHLSTADLEAFCILYECK